MSRATAQKLLKAASTAFHSRKTLGPDCCCYLSACSQADSSRLLSYQTQSQQAQHAPFVFTGAHRTFGVTWHTAGLTAGVLSSLGTAQRRYASSHREDADHSVLSSVASTESFSQAAASGSWDGSDGTTVHDVAQHSGIALSAADDVVAAGDVAAAAVAAGGGNATAASQFSADALSGLLTMAETHARVEALEGCWYPTWAMEKLLLSMHDMTGLPWWGALVATTFLVRIAMSPLVVFQQANAYNTARAQPELQLAIRQFRDRVAHEGYTNEMRQQYGTQVTAILKKYNANPVKALLPILANMPVFLGFFFAIRQLATVKIPSMTDEGILWFGNLTAADPYMILPVLTGLSMLATIELGAADGMQGQTPEQLQQFKWIFRFASVLVIPAAMTMPSAMLVYWTTSNLYAVLWAMLLKINAVRKICRLPDLAEVKHMMEMAARAKDPNYNAAAPQPSVKGKVKLYQSKPGKSGAAKPYKVVTEL